MRAWKRVTPYYCGLRTGFKVASVLAEGRKNDLKLDEDTVSVEQRRRQCVLQAP